MFKKIVRGILIFICFIVIKTTYAQEEITITTYYPSPIGVYRQLRSNQMSIGENYLTETMPANGMIVESQILLRDPFAEDPNVAMRIATTAGVELLFKAIGEDDPTIAEADLVRHNANIESWTNNSFYIGTRDPDDTGALTGGSIQFHIGDPNTSTVNPRLAIGENGNVGIGTPAPTYPLTTLHVRGNSILAGDNQDVETGRIRYVPDYFGAGGSSDAIIIEKTDNDKTVEGGMVLGFSTSAADNTSSYITELDGSLSPNPDWANTFTPTMTIMGNGMVGVGTSTNPSKSQVPWGGPLVVHGTSSLDDAFRIFSETNGNYMNFWVTDVPDVSHTYGTHANAGYIQMGDDQDTLGSLVLQESGGGVTIPSGLQVGNEIMAGQILARGNTSAGPQLDLSTGRESNATNEYFIRAESLNPGDTALGITTRRERFNLQLDGGAYFGSRVGIGYTADPKFLLDVNGDARIKTLQFVDNTKGDTFITTPNNILMYSETGTMEIGVLERDLIDPDIYTIPNYITLASSGSRDIIIYAGKNISINAGASTPPGLPLGSITGNVDFSCNSVQFNALTQWGTVVKTPDIAESIYAPECEAADIVIADPGNNLKAIKSNKPYDTSVMGIISTKPLLYLRSSDSYEKNKENPTENKDKEGYLPIALAGQVPCKVTTENGPINRGDLLVTSSKPGYAMKADLSTPEAKLKAFGAIIGKALEPLEKGEGKIIVMVNVN